MGNKEKHPLIFRSRYLETLRLKNCKVQLGKRMDEIRVPSVTKIPSISYMREGQKWGKNE